VGGLPRTAYDIGDTTFTRGGGGKGELKGVDKIRGEDMEGRIVRACPTGTAQKEARVEELWHALLQAKSGECGKKN